LKRRRTAGGKAAGTKINVAPKKASQKRGRTI